MHEPLAQAGEVLLDMAPKVSCSNVGECETSERDQRGVVEQCEGRARQQTEEEQQKQPLNQSAAPQAKRVLLYEGRGKLKIKR